MKTRVTKRGKAFFTPYRARGCPKMRKKEMVNNPLQAVDDARVNALLKWNSGIKAPKIVYGGMSEMIP